jgi:acyl-CoA synthetase (NDP forming)
LIKQKKWQEKPNEMEVEITKIEKEKIETLKKELKKEEKLCSIETTAHILKAFDVPFLEDKLATSIADVERIFDESKNKLVAKITSKDIAHKTDCG